MTHQVQWTAAAPLWNEAARSSDEEIRGQFRRPAILRFATDTFMEDFLALLDTNASRIAELVTQPETWRRPGPPLKREAIEPVTRFARSLERFRLPGGRVGHGPGPHRRRRPGRAWAAPDAPARARANMAGGRPGGARSAHRSGSTR
jgi:hypothetical protein